MKSRLDKLIFEKRLTDSREKAQKVIMAGLVSIDGRVADKPGALVSEDSNIVIAETDQYVGRGAEKIAGAARDFGLDFSGKVVADIGSSTGGFTDFALQNGAKKVYAVDVGSGQLDWRLRNDERVVVMEGVNARYLESLPELIDIFVMDVSFISVTKILPSLKKISEKAELVVLFKPQFEAGKEIVSKTRGVIKDPKIHRELLEEFTGWCHSNGFDIENKCDSPIVGEKGNKEFFFYLRAKKIKS